MPQEHAAGRRLHLPRGKVTGGSHALNAMIWVRGAASDYDGWERGGATGWGWSEVEPVYDAIENDLLPVTDDYPLSPIQASIIDAAVQEGLPHNPNYNGGTLDGVSQEQVTMRDGRRVNTWTTYAQPIADPLTILTGREVHSVIIEDGRAVGVRSGEGGGGRRGARRRGHPLGGRDRLPVILLRSGIGPAAELEALGIPVVQDLPGVGKNLHDHLLSPVIFTTARPVGPPQPGSRSRRRTCSGAAVTTSPSPTRSRSTSRCRCGASSSRGATTGSRSWPDSSRRTAAARSRCRAPVSPTRRTSTWPRSPTTAMWHRSPRPCASAVASARSPALAEEWGAVEVYPGPTSPMRTSRTGCAAPPSPTTTRSAPAGWGRDADAVVDPQLRVRGIPGLSVIDASVIPTVPTGNTNAPAAMIGERGATFVLEDDGEHRPQPRQAGVLVCTGTVPRELSASRPHGRRTTSR